MEQSNLTMLCALGIVGTLGCASVAISEPSTVTSTSSESTQAEVTSADCSVSTGQKITGTGTKQLEDKIFYYSDYRNSASDTYTQACVYAQDSSEDYYLEYVEDESGDTTGIKFFKKGDEK